MKPVRAVAVFVAVAAGLAAAGLLGGPLGPIALGAVVLCACGPWLAPVLVAAPWPLVTLAVLVGIGGWVWVDGPARLALGVALVYLQVHRVLGRTGASDDRVSLLLSGLMLVAAASSSENILWLVAFAVWSAALPVALLPFEVRSRSWASMRVVAGLAVGAVGLIALIFPVLPRLKSDPPIEDVARTGFTPTVELGAINQLLDDAGEVFRLQASPDFPEVPMYFRGVVLDSFDGRAWSSTVSSTVTEFQPPSRYPDDAVVLRFAGEAPDGALFTSGQVLHVESGGQPLRRDRHGAWRLEEPVEGFVEWMVVARPPWGPGAGQAELDGPRPGAYLQLPETLDPRVAELGAEIRGNAQDPAAVADQLARWLRREATYTRVPRDAGSEAPLAQFLFERRTGHCEYFASALAVLLRTQNVQSRVVNGFVGGEFDAESGHLMMRRYHAHAWTEVWVPGSGWVLVDATPGPGAPAGRGVLARLGDRVQSWWQEGVLGFDGERQRGALVSAGGAVESVVRSGPAAAGSFPWAGLVVIWAAALLAALLAERLLRRVGARLAGEVSRGPTGPVDRAWLAARSAAEGRLGSVPAALPPLSAARWLGERDAGLGGPLEELAWLVYRVRHGGEDPEALAAQAAELRRRVQHALRRATG